MSAPKEKGPGGAGGAARGQNHTSNEHHTGSRSTPATRSLADFARGYADHGFPVVPLWWSDDGQCGCGNKSCKSIAKHPISQLAPNGLHDASDDTATIANWWRRYPRANIGIRTGPESGILAVDVDDYKGGADGLAELERRIGSLPQTVTVNTGGGGRHGIYRFPGGEVPNRSGKSLGLVGLDFKATNGYIVAPPSIHASGRAYEFADDGGLCRDDLADAPEPLVELLRTGNAQSFPPPIAIGQSVGSSANSPYAKVAMMAIEVAPIENDGSNRLYAYACRAVEWNLDRRSFVDCVREVERHRPFPRAWTDPEILTRFVDAERDPSVVRGKCTPTTTRKAEHSKPAPPIPAWEPFPVDLLPQVAARFTRETADSMSCDPALVALHVIAILGVSIGTTRRIELKPSWHEFPIFWAVTIARSSGLKSPAMDAAIRELRKIQKAAFDEYNERQTAYEVDRVIYEKELATWKRSKDGGEPPSKPEPPTPRRFVVQDITIEALAPILESNPRGVLVARDELASHLRSFGQYKKAGSGDAAAWLEFHRGGSHIVDRKTGDRRLIIVHRAAVWKCGTIQPGVFSTVMSGEFIESGMAARFLMAKPPSAPKRWTDRHPGKATLDNYEELIVRLIRLQHIDDDGTPLDLPMTQEAKSIWIDWYNRHADLTYASDDEGEAAMLGKVEAYASRFALLFAVCDEPYATRIPADAMRRGCMLAGWFANEATRVYGTMADTADDRRRRTLVEWIEGQGSGDGVTVRDLTKGLRRFRDDQQSARAALDDLANAGFGSWRHVNTGGRPTERFELKYPAATNAAPVPETPYTDTASRGNGDGDVVGDDRRREDLEERAAIMEYDGQLPRELAEAEAKRTTGYDDRQ